jgi:hypothetical protein
MFDSLAITVVLEEELSIWSEIALIKVTTFIWIHSSSQLGCILKHWMLLKYFD